MQFFGAEKTQGETFAQPAHQQKHQRRAHQAAEHGQPQAGQRAVEDAGQHLQRLAGEEGDDDLQDLQGQVHKGGPGAKAVEIGRDLLGGAALAQQPHCRPQRPHGGGQKQGDEHQRGQSPVFFATGARVGICFFDGQEKHLLRQMGGEDLCGYAAGTDAGAGSGQSLE